MILILLLSIINILQGLIVYILTRKRDDSHNYKHMMRVWKNATEIIFYEDIIYLLFYQLFLFLILDFYQFLIINEIYILFNYPLKKIYLVNGICWFHDLCDYKYNDISFNTLNFLTKIFYFFEPQFNLALKSISYSKEKENFRWYEKYLNYHLLIARDIASDADKLDTLGKDAFDRAYQYSVNQRKDRNEKQHYEKSIEICNDRYDKLLKDRYIKTNYGRKRGFYLLKVSNSILINKIRYYDENYNN